VAERKRERERERESERERERERARAREPSFITNIEAPLVIPGERRH